VAGDCATAITTMIQGAAAIWLLRASVFPETTQRRSRPPLARCSSSDEGQFLPVRDRADKKLVTVLSNPETVSCSGETVMPYHV
jgi:hypothetical protein